MDYIINIGKLPIARNHLVMSLGQTKASAVGRRRRGVLKCVFSSMCIRVDTHERAHKLGLSTIALTPYWPAGA